MLSHQELVFIRSQFPILSKIINGKLLIYLDNAASMQKPEAVIKAICDCYSCYYSNINRGVHFLSESSTVAYENVREIVKIFINASNKDEIIFTSGTTESINLVASSFGSSRFQQGDEVVITHMEHHSNLVPWQVICKKTGAVLKVISFNNQGNLIMEECKRILGSGRVKLLSLVHLSNTIGTVNPIKHIVKMAHEHDIPVLVDGAQAIAHLSVDVLDLDCDFYAFSAHKIYGPSGVGVLYGKLPLLEDMPPYKLGGGMIKEVTLNKTKYAEVPSKFEAGTPNIAGVIGLGAALSWINSLGGIDLFIKHENILFKYATEQLMNVPNLKILGDVKNKAALISFIINNIHPHDIGTILNNEGIAIRAGHHCAQPVMDYYGVPATARVSFAVYNSTEEIDILVNVLHKLTELFK